MKLTVDPEMNLICFAILPTCDRYGLNVEDEGCFGSSLARVLSACECSG